MTAALDLTPIAGLVSGISSLPIDQSRFCFCPAHFLPSCITHLNEAPYDHTNRMNGICLALFQQFPKQKNAVSVHVYLDEEKEQVVCLEICIDYMVKRVPYCTNIKKSRSHRIRGNSWSDNGTITEKMSCIF